MKVILTAAALADLQEIAGWIRRDNPARARSFIDELESKCLELGARARLYPLALKLGPGVRKRSYKGYLILYRIEMERVEVLHCVHGSRNFRAMFDDI